ncbi:helix-turn-helix domain-containing protein [Lactococcus fujiensis]|uniref:XRE family transcriptional regulator n=1 Tax=Lactococcus fujiensis JCM 16395 TaxID=1291764 RepID=A0A2A5RJ58_9LACT|nr:helix-turn-helix transcriptional regulator [Lactococcus fujiensis]PCR99152.1 XRE family transcriptional regulator [Lactococcus fujiensis JCM 16395]
MMAIIIGEQIKKLRKEQNKSQDWLAEQLFFSRQAISKWESGDFVPDVETCERLSKIFNVSLDYLISGIETSGPKIDPQEFIYDPNKNKYIRKREEMNGWQFFAMYWWLLFPIGGFIDFVLNIR